MNTTQIWDTKIETKILIGPIKKFTEAKIAGILIGHRTLTVTLYMKTPVTRSEMSFDRCCDHKLKIIEERMYRDDTDHNLVKCQVCEKCCEYRAVWSEDIWKELKSFIYSDSAEDKNSIKVVETDKDRCILFLLCAQYSHFHVDTGQEESPFAIFSYNEVAKLLWRNGQAVGFYTIKLKGSPFDDNQPHVSYCMPMVDTFYICPSHRRQGLAMTLLQDIVHTYQNQYIGFSQPISLSMQRVLLKYLRTHATMRDLLWGCSYTGEEGYRENIWLQLKNKCA